MMKKCIGLICSAVLLVAFVVGCSDSFGFDGKDIDMGTDGMTSGANPFVGTKWERTEYSLTYKISFEKEGEAKYYNGNTNIPYTYTWEQDHESKKYVAHMINDYNGNQKIEFWIDDVNADKGYDMYNYNGQNGEFKRRK